MQNTIQELRETLSASFLEVDKDKMLMKGWRFLCNDKVIRQSGFKKDQIENMNLDIQKEVIQKSLFKCAQLDFFSKYENDDQNY